MITGIFILGLFTAGIPCGAYYFSQGVKLEKSITVVDMGEKNDRNSHTEGN